jgi:hypothetical protein
MALFTDPHSLGRIVHYVMQDSDYMKEGAYAGGGAPPVQGQTPPATPRHRPAIIVETWGCEKESDPKAWALNLLFFRAQMAHN